MPAVGLKRAGGVVAEPALGVPVDGNVVVVPKRHQLAQAEGAGERGRFVRDAPSIMQPSPMNTHVM